jgi:hypothetical protein
MKGFAFPVLIALSALLLACGGGEGEGELYFQAGDGEMRVSGAKTLDATLTKVTGPDHALYRPNGGIPPHLVIALQSPDGRVRLSGSLWEIRRPGKYYIVNELTLILGEADYYYGHFKTGCTVTIDAATDKLFRGRLSCAEVRGCVAAPGAAKDVTGNCGEGYRLETVDMEATFRLESPKRLPLPTPVRVTPTPIQ